MQLTPQKAWAGLAAYVIVADAVLIRRNKDTLSIQFGKWLQDPKTRTACIAASALVLSHLYWSFPLPGQKILRKVAEK